jgi:hypothetical protein
MLIYKAKIRGICVMNYQSKIKLSKMINFLKKSHGEESAYLISLANQNDMALDQKPLRFKKDDFDVDFPEDMIESDDSCDMVNFGIAALQKERISESLKRKKIYMPENINFVHFDLEKLYKCMESNEFSKKLYDLFASLSRVRASYSMTVESFIKRLNRFPMVKEAFESVLSKDNINFLIIGTSDASYNFLGSEVAAQKFHQLTVNHVIHDLGHASYDFRNDVKERRSKSSVERARFAPIGIFAKYVLDVIKRFEFLKEKAFKRAGKEIDPLDLSYADRAAAISTGLNFQIIQGILRNHKKYYDVRFLVGTRGAEDNLGSKSFTDKSDFDQDIFSYIMQIEEGQTVSDIFKNPTLPKEMELFFERMSEYLDEGDKESFIKYIKEKHSKAVSEVEEDLARVSKIMNVDQDLSETSPSQGYITYMTQDLGDMPEGAPLFIFNMSSRANTLSNLPSERVKHLYDKKYIDKKDLNIRDNYVSTSNKGKITTKIAPFSAIVKIISNGVEKLALLKYGSDASFKEFKVGDAFRFEKENGLDLISEIFQGESFMEDYLDREMIEYKKEEDLYLIKALTIKDDWGQDFNLDLRYQDFSEKDFERFMMSVRAPHGNI